jgi:hypothetical protein
MMVLFWGTSKNRKFSVEKEMMFHKKMTMVVVTFMFLIGTLHAEAASFGKSSFSSSSSSFGSTSSKRNSITTNPAPVNRTTGACSNPGGCYNNSNNSNNFTDRNYSNTDYNASTVVGTAAASGLTGYALSGYVMQSHNNHNGTTVVHNGSGTVQGNYNGNPVVVDDEDAAPTPCDGFGCIWLFGAIIIFFFLLWVFDRFQRRKELKILDRMKV